MNNHKNARLTVHDRTLLVKRILEQGLRPEEAAQAAGVSSVRTAYKWLKRYREHGPEGLNNTSSRPHHCPHALCAEVRQKIIEARKSRQTYRQISQHLRVGHSTIARILRHEGLNRLSSLEPAKPLRRYEHDHPGGLLHLDIKKLGRFHRPGHRVTGDRHQGSHGAGWEYVHVAIDDHSRIGFSAIYPDETSKSACAALLRAVRYYQSPGIRFERVLTDNGACYKSRRVAYADAWGSPIDAPSPTRHAPTARPSASSRPRSASGPTHVPMIHPSSVPRTCPCGCISPTGTVPMLASITCLQSPAFLR